MTSPARKPLSPFRGSLFSIALALGSLTAFAPAAMAQDTQKEIQAEAFFKSGQDAMAKSDFAGACKSFEASQKAAPSIGAAYNLGQCHEKLGNFASSYLNYKTAGTLARQRNDARAGDADAGAKAVEPKLSYLTLTSPTPLPAESQITIDGAAFDASGLGTPYPVDGGKRVIAVNAKGYKPWSGEIEMGKESDKKSMEIPALEALPPGEDGVVTPPGGATPEESGPNTGLLVAGIVVGGVGVVGLALGGAFGGIASGKKSDLETQCPNLRCGPGEPQDTLDSANTAATVSTVGFIAGGVLVAGGVVMAVIGATSGGSSKDEEQAPVGFVPFGGPEGGGFMLHGAF